MEKCSSCVLLIFSIIGVIICHQIPKHHEPHASIHTDHYDKDGKHDSSYDHQAVLGSKEEEAKFANLSPEKAKERLGKYVDLMDVNKDGHVDKTELTEWVMKSFVSLDNEEAMESMKTNDKNADGFVAWAEYLEIEHQTGPEQFEASLTQGDSEDQDVVNYNQYLRDEKMKFQMADVDKDGKLSKDEYPAFEHPHQHEHMYEFEFGYRMRTFDKDKDGMLTFEEYYVPEVDEETADTHRKVYEKTMFEEYDKDKNGKLDKSELKKWVMLTQDDTAAEEADHLIHHSDSNYDEVLSKQEILDHHYMWVGSEASSLHAHIKDEL